MFFEELGEKEFEIPLSIEPTPKNTDKQKEKQKEEKPAIMRINMDALQYTNSINFINMLSNRPTDIRIQSDLVFIQLMRETKNIIIRLNNLIDTAEAFHLNILLYDKNARIAEYKKYKQKLSVLCKDINDIYYAVIIKITIIDINNTIGHAVAAIKYMNTVFTSCTDKIKEINEYINMLSITDIGERVSIDEKVEINLSTPINRIISEIRNISGTSKKNNRGTNIFML